MSILLRPNFNKGTLKSQIKKGQLEVRVAYDHTDDSAGDQERNNGKTPWLEAAFMDDRGLPSSGRLQLDERRILLGPDSFARGSGCWLDEKGIVTLSPYPNLSLQFRPVGSNAGEEVPHDLRIYRVTLWSKLDTERHSASTRLGQILETSGFDPEEALKRKFEVKTVHQRLTKLPAWASSDWAFFECLLRDGTTAIGIVTEELR